MVEVMMVKSTAHKQVVNSSNCFENGDSKQLVLHQSFDTCKTCFPDVKASTFSPILQYLGIVILTNLKKLV